MSDWTLTDETGAEVTAGEIRAILEPRGLCHEFVYASGFSDQEQITTTKAPTNVIAPHVDVELRIVRKPSFLSPRGAIVESAVCPRSQVVAKLCELLVRVAAKPPASGDDKCKNPLCRRIDGKCVGYHCPRCGDAVGMMGHDCAEVEPPEPLPNG